MPDSLTVGSTFLFVHVAYKDGLIWDLSSATVTLSLRDPNGAIVVNSATILSGPAGLVQYVGVVGDITMTDQGQRKWARRWNITDGAIVQHSHWIEFSVPD